MEKLMAFVKNLLENPDKKRLIENCVIVIIIGIIIIIAAGSFFRDDHKGKDANVDEKNSTEVLGKSVSNEERVELEKKVEGILSQIAGAGKVSVAITFFSSEELVPAYDTKKIENDTQEKDSGGGTRNVKNNDTDSKVAYEDQSGGGKKPIIIKTLQPAVKGVVVVADGAGEVQVKENICRAIQVLLDVPVHRVQVFQRSR